LKSNLISKSETAEVIKEISSQWKIELPKIKNLKFHYFDDDIIIISGEGLKAIKNGESYLPFLTDTQILKKFPHVMVDMGAVKFMCKGANVMRPGITNYTQFEKRQCGLHYRRISKQISCCRKVMCEKYGYGINE